MTSVVPVALSKSTLMMMEGLDLPSILRVLRSSTQDPDLWLLLKQGWAIWVDVLT